MKRLSLVLTLALALPAGGSDPARAASTFTFYGSGFGNGIGASQYGMQGLALEGWGPGRILRHYYRGTVVRERAAPVSPLRVGLLQDRGIVGLKAVGGGYELALAGGRVIATVGDGVHRRVQIRDGRYRILRPNGSVIGNRSWGSSGNDLLVRPKGGRVLVDEWGHHVGRGHLRFRIVGNGTAHLSAVVGSEGYLFGVAEVPNSWHMRALRSQAIASRTFLYWRLGQPRSGCFCHILPTTADQFWIGADKETSVSGERWVKAVKDSRRKVVLHDGSPIFATYSSSSGGYTDTPSRVWPAGSDLPYLKPVCDPAEFAHNPNRSWSVSFDAATLTSKLSHLTGNIGTIQRFRAYDQGTSGRVTWVTVQGSSGSARVHGWNIRTALGLKDTRFYVNENRNINGKVRAEYDRVNCRPGRAMAARKAVTGGNFQRFEKGRIYHHRGRNRTTWLRGAVLEEYLSLGGHRSDLKLPYRYTSQDGVRTGYFDGGKIICDPGCRVRYS